MSYDDVLSINCVTTTGQHFGLIVLKIMISSVWSFLLKS